jgi:hypothetical protein
MDEPPQGAEDAKVWTGRREKPCVAYDLAPDAASVLALQPVFNGNHAHKVRH